jgi:hypothetical protein
MRTLAGWILKKQGWKITGDYGGIKKSITIFAPHTAHIDYYYGKLGFTELGVKFKFLSKKEMGVKSIIYDTSDFKTVLAEINAVYKDVKGKNPEQFAIHSE